MSGPHAVAFVAGLIVSAVAALGWVVFLRAKIPSFRRPWATLALVFFAVSIEALPALVRIVATHGGPSWVMWIYGIALLVDLTIAAALPLVVASEAARWLARRRRRTLARNRDTPGRDESSEVEPTRRDALSLAAAGIALAGTSAPILWGTLRTRIDIEVVEHVVKIASLPRALEGFSIAQVSDAHVGPFFSERDMRRAEELVAKMRPDLIAMTGDLVHLHLGYLSLAVGWVARLARMARHGACAIPGNHEYYAGRDAVLGALSRAGIDVLFNRERLVAKDDGGGIGIVGVDDLIATERKIGPGPRVLEPLANLPVEAPRILLCHQPTFLSQAAAHGFDLMLSGHTHGGQIAVVGPIAARAGYHYVAGAYDLEQTHLYVNRGLGTSGPPSRIAVRPEITKIVLVAG